MTQGLKQRWVDDYRKGEVFEFGSYTVTQAEIIGFATQYDPQFFHIDPEAAMGSAYGGLISMGWLTTAIAMRMMCDHFISVAPAMGSPSVDHVRWLHPVRPGDTLGMRVSVLDTRRSESKPKRGVVTLRQELINQNNEVVMSLEGSQ